jgi:tetratricopeptide (TPR) repeat protein
MEAYKYFSEGVEESRKFYWKEANSNFKKAIEIDPTFAMAYLYLSLSCVRLANLEARDEAIIKAKEYANRATEKERLYIDAHHAFYIEKNDDEWFQIFDQMAKKYPKEKLAYVYLGFYFRRKQNLEKAIEMYDKALELDPDYGEVHNTLGYIYKEQENYEKALEHFRKYSSIRSGEPNPIDSMADIYFSLGRLDEALEKFKEALEIRPDFHLSMRNIPYIYALKEDYSKAIDRIDKFIVTHTAPRERYLGYLWKGFYFAWLGRLNESFDYMTQAQEIVESYGATGQKFYIEAIKSLISWEMGQIELSRKLNESWYPVYMELYSQARFYYKAKYVVNLGLIDLKEENLESAKLRLSEEESLFAKISNPQHKRWVRYYFNILEGEIFLAEGLFDKAIDLFTQEQSIPPPALEYVTSMVYYNLPFTVDILARAYQQIGELDKAIQEYERLITFDPTSENRRLIHPLYYYRLALLYEQKDWKGKAIEHYEKFLTLWKDADPGIDEVEVARKRLAGLKDN